jgi:hypothetical protein
MGIAWLVIEESLPYTEFERTFESLLIQSYGKFVNGSTNLCAAASSRACTGHTL